METGIKITEKEVPKTEIKKIDLVIEDDIKQAKEKENEPEINLLLNELIALRNIQNKRLQKKDYAISLVVVVENNTKRRLAGIYRKNSLTESEVEDIIISCDYNNEKVLIISRESVCVDLLK